MLQILAVHGVGVGFGGEAINKTRRTRPSSARRIMGSRLVKLERVNFKANAVDAVGRVEWGK